MTPGARHNLLCAKARTTALRRFAQMHPDAFHAVLAEERDKLGLPPRGVRRKERT